MSDWPLLTLPADYSDAELITFCWEYFRGAYLEDNKGNRIEVRDWRGVLVLVSRYVYDHIISGDTNYRDGLGLHEVPFKRDRAERLPWIGLSIAGDCVVEVRHQERPAARGRRRKTRVLIVTEKSYVVVLDRQGDGCLRLRTAFPADASYLTKIRREGAQIEIRKPPREKEMPQS